MYRLNSQFLTGRIDLYTQSSSLQTADRIPGEEEGKEGEAAQAGPEGERADWT